MAEIKVSSTVGKQQQQHQKKNTSISTIITVEWVLRPFHDMDWNLALIYAQF